MRSLSNVWGATTSHLRRDVRFVFVGPGPLNGKTGIAIYRAAHPGLAMVQFDQLFLMVPHLESSPSVGAYLSHGWHPFSRSLLRELP